MILFIGNECSICGRHIDRQKNSYADLAISHDKNKDPAVWSDSMTLCKSCRQSFYSWIKNRRKKKLGD